MIYYDIQIPNSKLLNDIICTYLILCTSRPIFQGYIILIYIFLINYL